MPQEHISCRDISWGEGHCDSYLDLLTGNLKEVNCPIAHWRCIGVALHCQLHPAVSKDIALVVLAILVGCQVWVDCLIDIWGPCP